MPGYTFEPNTLYALVQYLDAMEWRNHVYDLESTGAEINVITFSSGVFTFTIDDSGTVKVSSSVSEPSEANEWPDNSEEICHFLQLFVSERANNNNGKTNNTKKNNKKGGKRSQKKNASRRR